MGPCDTRVKYIEKKIPSLLNLLCGITQKSVTFVFELIRSSTGDIQLYRTLSKVKRWENRRRREEEEENNISAHRGGERTRAL